MELWPSHVRVLKLSNATVLPLAGADGVTCATSLTVAVAFSLFRVDSPNFETTRQTICWPSRSLSNSASVCSYELAVQVLLEQLEAGFQENFAPVSFTVTLITY